MEIAFQLAVGLPRAKSAQMDEEAVGIFYPSACLFEKPAWAVEGKDLNCGTVIVPQLLSQPDGRTLKLAVVVIKASSEGAKPDPLFMAQGGPGGATIDTYAARLLNDRTFLPDRDIVLFDQRGTGYSTPRLYCTELDELTAETIEQDLSIEQENLLSQQAIESCHLRFIEDEDVDFSVYNSLENAADIDLIREALGYEQINFYGVSYGTLLGLHYMRLFPTSLKSVILDAVVPPQTNFILNSPQTMDASFQKLFTACETDAACNQEYPNLESVFFKTVDDLNQHPARISVSDPETDIKYDAALVDGDAFLGMTFQMLYAGSLIPAMPRMIYDAQSGRFEFFSKIFELLVFDRSMSLGMYYSVICSEDADFSIDEFNLQGVHPEIARIEENGPADLLDTCAIWEVDQLGPTADLPVFSNVPTLLLSGYFDPITPPSYAEQVASTLSYSQHLIFPTGAHGQALEGSCPNGIIQDFLNDPNGAVDSSCLDISASPEFITPQNTIDLPIGLMLLNGDPLALGELLLFALNQLVLLSAVVLIPLIALVAYSRKKKAAASIGGFLSSNTVQAGEYTAEAHSAAYPKTEANMPFSSKIAGWMPVISGPILFLFSILFSITLFELAVNNDTRLWFGVPATMRSLFLLPLLFALLSGLITLLCLTAWVKGYWSIWTRVFYTLLAFASIVCSVILANWGFLTAVFK